MRIYCVSRMWERRTCLRSESISSSFCFIWARRYSRLLKGENEHSSSSREVRDEGGRETARSSIMGGGGKVGGDAKTEEDFSAEQGLPNKNGRATRRRGGGRRWLTLGHFLVFGLRQYNHACPICSACTRSRQEENNISSDGAHEVKGYLSW